MSRSQVSHLLIAITAGAIMTGALLVWNASSGLVGRNSLTFLLHGVFMIISTAIFFLAFQVPSLRQRNRIRKLNKLPTISGDILHTSSEHILLAINVEGINDTGFAGEVMCKFWPELACTGGNKLGDVLSKKYRGKYFHAVVCYSKRDGWQSAPFYIEQALNKLAVPKEQPVAVIMIGRSSLGQQGGANAKEIEMAMRRSKQRIVIYRRH